jgi:hypothetical protein
MSPRFVLKVASQTEVAAMQVGGAFVNNTTRLADPVAGGHVGTTAAVVNGWVVGVGNVVGGTVLDVVVEAGTVVVLDVDVVVVVVLADFVLELFTSSTMPTMTRTRIEPPITRRVVRRRFLPFSMTACFCSRAARCRALLSVGTDRHAT